MESRIPLSIVMSTPSRRHAIPHITLSLPADSAFFSYLASDDTRLPNHPYLNGRSVDPTEYETYVGEDVWEQPDNVVDSSEGEDNGDGHGQKVQHADLVFDNVVEWLVQALEGNEWTRDGFVVCGRYVVADDAAWAVPSRSPTLYTPREAFMVMRCSCKFLNDIHAQRAERGGGEITIAKAMAGSAAKEMRAFLPYRLTRSSSSDDNPPLVDWQLSKQLLGYAGVCQRHTDVCFPSLMAWSESQHHDHFSLMMERLKKSELLERACERDPAFLSTLVSKWLKRNSERPEGATPPPNGFIAFLAVDLLFENASLPIPLLSAKVRLFPAQAVAAPSFVGLPEAPFLVEPPDEEKAVTRGADEGVPEEQEGRTDSTSEGSEVEDEETDATDFFRLFRNEINWNHYVEEMESRLDSAAHDVVTRFRRTAANVAGSNDAESESVIPLPVLSDVKVSHYVVVASDVSDLVTCGDTLMKRGLPLELQHPELLHHSQEGIELLKSLSEKLLKEARPPQT